MAVEELIIEKYENLKKQIEPFDLEEKQSHKLLTDE